MIIFPSNISVLFLYPKDNIKSITAKLPHPQPFLPESSKSRRKPFSPLQHFSRKSRLPREQPSRNLAVVVNGASCIFLPTVEILEQSSSCSILSAWMIIQFNFLKYVYFLRTDCRSFAFRLSPRDFVCRSFFSRSDSSQVLVKFFFLGKKILEENRHLPARFLETLSGCRPVSAHFLGEGWIQRQEATNLYYLLAVYRTEKLSLFFWDGGGKGPLGLDENLAKEDSLEISRVFREEGDTFTDFSLSELWTVGNFLDNLSRCIFYIF